MPGMLGMPQYQQNMYGLANVPQTNQANNLQLQQMMRQRMQGIGQVPQGMGQVPQNPQAQQMSQFRNMFGNQNNLNQGMLQQSMPQNTQMGDMLNQRIMQLLQQRGYK